MKRQLYYEIQKDFNTYTIEKFLRLNGFSSANITALKKMPENAVLNGKWVHLTHNLSAGDKLIINISEDTSSEKIPAIHFPLDIIYEDEDIIVINKPANMPIHPSLNHYENSLANALAYYYEVEQNTAFVFRCSNRLDKDTSGLTIISKNMLAGSILSTSIKNKDITREYLAIVDGILTQREGVIDAPIGRVNDSIITRCIDYENGQSAITHYKVLEEKDGLSLVSIILETGRTHQIRVHFNHIGHPLVGDYLYNPNKCSKFSRQALHSYKMTITHPITKEKMTFVAPLPNDMQIGWSTTSADNP